MEKTRLVVDPAYTIAPVDPRIFGGFLEHIGRAVYEGVYDPASRYADENGFRRDTLAALHKLQMTAMRYPGGNFASGYHWIDGVGPKDQRPTVYDKAWESVEPNHFGTDEFLKLTRLMNWTPMLTVNLGTGTPEEARDWVEYCNGRSGSRYANLRAENGSVEPYNVRLWCLGNEIDGHWQMGHAPAKDYAVRAHQAAKFMKDIDPDIETVACGSTTMSGSTYIEWDLTVLEHLGPYADYVSLHRYVGNPENNTADYLAGAVTVDQRIDHMDAVCRVVQAKTRSKKRHYLCFDEWNVWYRANGPEDTNGKGKFAPALIEEPYNLEDALVVASFLNSFIRHADSVKIANLAQIVNVLAPIRTRGDELLLQSIYYPFAMFSCRREGVSIQPVVIGPKFDSPSYGRVDYIDASAIFGDGALHVFLVNRHLSEAAEVEIVYGGEAIESILSAEVVFGSNPKESNTFEMPSQVIRHPLKSGIVREGKAIITLPALSVAAITFRIP